ncbi:hypothetical protein Agub_g5253 [Astrephomene gubernaculifera]|uniref:RNA ligase/cyclic nucleotide phosphodiesterase family protein n=1 Tax=Astrephomene gubernaculifera TaxID=47775 RepID=A0AAD3HKM3_9CHLO|nr:hypothetical protein Agub_g5253 [Astrephomene gubernaculifera]
MASSSSDPATTPTEFISLFAVPKGALAQQLTDEISHLAHREAAPPFPPHVTVAGAAKSRAEALQLAEQLAGRVKPYRINFTGVSAGTTFYQCVYLLVAQEEGTMAAAAAAREVFGLTGAPPYMPHLSLLYSDMDQGERQRVVEYETSRLYGDSPATRLLESGFDVGSLQVWSTPLDDSSLKSWRLVGEVRLVGQ